MPMRTWLSALALVFASLNSGWAAGLTGVWRGEVQMTDSGSSPEPVEMIYTIVESQDSVYFSTGHVEGGFYFFFVAERNGQTLSIDGAPIGEVTNDALAFRDIPYLDGDLIVSGGAKLLSDGSLETSAKFKDAPPSTRSLLFVGTVARSVR